MFYLRFSNRIVKLVLILKLQFSLETYSADRRKATNMHLGMLIHWSQITNKLNAIFKKFVTENLSFTSCNDTIAEDKIIIKQNRAQTVFLSQKLKELIA